MKNRIGRREFIKHGFVISTSAIAGSVFVSTDLLGNLLASKLDISVASGANYFENTIKSVEILGGMKKFVPKDSRVGLLINSPWNKSGTYTNPDIALAVLKMCLDAGAKEIYSIEDAPANYWKRSNSYEKFEKEVGRIKSDNSKSNVRIPKAKVLKEAEISKVLQNCDVFINIPIVKNHSGTQFTANLKNLMGACSRSTNRFFHNGSGKSGTSGYYDDVEFLSRCIADVNLIRKPDLCVVDATEFVTNNGPAGPGEIKKARKVVAGTDCVSVDAYCATLLGMKPSEVSMIRYAGELGLGEIDLGKLTIKEI